MIGNISHFSYSQLNTYLTCPLRYRLQYVELIPPAFTPSALAFGHAIHEALAAFHQQHMLGDSLKPDQMLDVYNLAYSGRNGEPISCSNGDDENTLREKALQIITVYHVGFNPEVDIFGVEEFFETNISYSTPPFQGYIDLIECKPDGTTTIVDLKTAARKLSGSQVDLNQQLTAYSIGAAALGFNPDRLCLRLDVLTKTKNPELVRYETIRSNRDRERFTKLATQVWNAIEREAFYPKQDWHCQQCGWAEPCSKW